MPRPKPPASLPAHLTAALLLAASAAHAQWSGSLALLSDDRYRGLSRSDGKPSARAAVAFDLPQGWYAGAVVSRARLWPGHSGALWQAYGGRSARWSPTLGWELGLSTVHHARASAYDFTELYAGLLAPRWQARLHLSPDHYGRGTASTYAELDTHWPLHERLRLVAHAGWLHVQQRPAYGRRQRADLRLGVAGDVEALQWQLAWSGAERGGPYPTAHDRGRWSLSVAYFF